MRRWTIAIAALALTVVGAGACAGSSRGSGGGSGDTHPVLDCTGPSPSAVSTFQPPPTTDPSFWQAQARLGELASRVEALVTRFPDAYAGVALEQEHARLAVYRVPSPAFDAALRRELPDAPVRLVDAAHSARELTALLDRILADRAYWEGQGIALNEVSAGYDGSCVEVGTQATDQARRLFPQRYGPEAAIRIVHAEPAVPL